MNVTKKHCFVKKNENQQSFNNFKIKIKTISFPESKTSDDLFDETQTEKVKDGMGWSWVVLCHIR